MEILGQFSAETNSQDLDADLFALARRVKELSLERDRAYDVLSELRDSFELKPPASLLGREGDERLAGVRDGEFAGIGKPFSQEKLKVIRMMRPMFQSLSAAESFGPDLQAKFSAGLDRILEIDFAAAQYQSDLKASREAAGITAAKARYDSIDDLLGKTRRDLAFTRALTIEGVHAKIEAVADCYSALEPEDHTEGCDDADVVEMAIVDLVSLRKAAVA